MRPVGLTVYGRIAPKGSRTLARGRGGSVYTRPASNYEHRWVETVAQHASWLCTELVDLPPAPYRVRLAFYFARPKRPAHEHPSRVDVDKCARAVLDGLVRGGLLTDDRHVTELTAAKHWAQTADGECCRVEVETVAPAEVAA